LEGSYREFRSPPGVFAFERVCDGEVVLAAINTSGEHATVALDRPGTILLSTERRQDGARVEKELKLAPLAAAMVAIGAD
jgi:hypothetical protein